MVTGPSAPTRMELDGASISFDVRYRPCMRTHAIAPPPAANPHIDAVVAHLRATLTVQ